MKIQKIYIGGWFQRTTLHLSEIYDFLKNTYSPLIENKEKLKRLRDSIGVKSVEMRAENVEYLDILTDSEIEVKIYGDGLILLSKHPIGGIKDDIEDLNSFYEKKLSPAVNYIFSLGALVPKELEKVQNIYPYFIVLNKAKPAQVDELLEKFQQNRYFEIKIDPLEIYRGSKMTIINNRKSDDSVLEAFIREQVFIREFKSQMHKYLNLHRVIWERVKEMRERGKIRGKDVPDFKERIESYSSTVNLIEARISQMKTYIKSRESSLKGNRDLASFSEFFKSKYDTLNDTLEYVEEIWSMTKNYVKSAMELLSDIQKESTGHYINNLVMLTSMSFLAIVVGLLTKEVPKFTWFGLGYFVAIALIGFTANRLIAFIYKRKMYAVEDVKAATDVQNKINF